MSYPVDGTARQRLLAAQRAESDALRLVEQAERTRARMALRAAKAESEVLKAQRVLVEVSGVARASLLLDLDERELRRNLRVGNSVTQKTSAIHERP